MTSTKTTALLAFCLFMQCVDGARTKAKIEGLEVDSAEVVAPLTDEVCKGDKGCDKKATQAGCVEYYRCEGADGKVVGTDFLKLAGCRDEVKAKGLKGACKKRCAVPKSMKAAIEPAQQVTSPEPAQQVTSPQAEVDTQPDVIAQPEVIDQPEPDVAKPELTDLVCNGHKCDKKATEAGCVEYYRCEGADGKIVGTDFLKLAGCADEVKAKGLKGACKKRCAVPK